MPLDHFVEEPVTRMIVVDDADSLLEIQREVIEIACEAECREVRRAPLSVLPSIRSPARALRSCATEFRPYGCFLFKMGVIFDR
jgi:L-fucose mutarotase/ribose pyranase (RbsD/FucU family)